jgi:DNA-binding GntR family transcriptional regulator
MHADEDVPDWAATLVADRQSLVRSSTAQRVADVLRTRITEGMFPPGARLSEEIIGGSLGVSRNTLREAFRLLIHERLVVHELNRGVFVRRLHVDDVIDAYRVRRIIERYAIRHADHGPTTAIGDMRQALEQAQLAADEERWSDVGTENLRFHQAIVGMAHSPRLDDITRQLLAETRLALHILTDGTHHRPYLADNHEILDLVCAGDVDRADAKIDDYLLRAEQTLVDAYRKRPSRLTSAP